MRVLITGGAGFIGSHTAEHCLAAGHSVVVLDNLSSGKRGSVPLSATFYNLDVRDSAICEVFKKERPEIVCHLAALTNVRESMQRPLLYADVNVLGSLRLLECCRVAKVRKIIYACTGGAAYGEPHVLPVPEDHSINPLDPYGASKHHVEHYLYLYRQNYDLDFTVLRYANVYGPRQDPSGEAGVVAIFAMKMLTGDQPVINGHGHQLRDYTYVSDVANANLLAFDKGGGRTYNIGTGIGVSVVEMFEKLRVLTGFHGVPEYGPSKPGEVSRIFLDVTRARTELRWSAQTNLADGLCATVNFFRSHIDGTFRHSIDPLSLRAD